jgi:hypothetical protein
LLINVKPDDGVAGVAHCNPVASPLAAVRTVPSAPTANLAGVSAAVAVSKSALASKMVGWIPPSIEGILPVVIL